MKVHARLKLALKAMTEWRRVNRVHRWERRPLYDDDEGRYGFRVWHMRPSRRRGAQEQVECGHFVLMPGVPLKLLKDEHLIDVPRLYVDGNSWWWKFSHLTCGEE